MTIEACSRVMTDNSEIEVSVTRLISPFVGAAVAACRIEISADIYAADNCQPTTLRIPSPNRNAMRKGVSSPLG